MPCHSDEWIAIVILMGTEVRERQIFFIVLLIERVIKSNTGYWQKPGVCLDDALKGVSKGKL
jgi:hypothetical protein